MLVDLRSKVYYITPAEVADTAELVRLVRLVVRAGVGMVQYRAKSASGRRMYRDVEALLGFTRPAGIPLIVNDAVDIALATGADGVHVGEEDLPVNVVRRMVGPKAIVGASADQPEAAKKAERDGATYVACGAVFPSPTKQDKPVIGPQGVAAVQRVVNIPVCAIGGINAENIYQLQEVSPALVAVISAINTAEDPAIAAHRLVEASLEALPHRTLGL